MTDAVLLVEDERPFHDLVSSALGEQFHVVSVSTLQDAEHMISQQQFEFALVDENLNGDSGSEWIKQRHDNENFPRSAIIYSGSAAEETLLKALDSGASDYLQKPFPMQLLKQKLKNLKEYHRRLDHYQSELDSKDDVIVTALTQAAKFGQCMQVTKELNQCMNMQAMADCLQRFLRQVGLRAIIGLRQSDEQRLAIHSERGTCSPLEERVIHELAGKKRVYTFGPRAAFNHELASILVTNFAQSPDSEVWIDALASLIEAVASRIQFLHYHQSMLDVQTMVRTALGDTRNLVNAAKQNREDAVAAIRQSISISFHVLDLSEEQENYLSNLVETTLKEHASDEADLQQIRAELDGILAKIEALTEAQEINATPVSGPSLNLDDDILF